MVSADQGPSEYAGPTELLKTPAGAITTPPSTYTAFTGGIKTSATLDSDKGVTSTGTGTQTFSAGINVAATIYKNTGYFAGGNTFESWLTVSTPSTSSVNPNTGHTLTNVTHEAMN